ncbi:MAG: PD40 domain-containing protein [Flavobacteriales bacterium]|nr:PD40 domain-containing protein [Flavobacteriales bacterium]
MNSPDLVTHKMKADGIILGFSGDDKQIHVYQDNDIYVGQIVKGECSDLEPTHNRSVGQNAYEPDFFFSKDGSALYFSSDREGGFGGLDLYVSTLGIDDTWSIAQNLGPRINTAYDEVTPFMIKNNSRLYFLSKGHSSMRGFDVFFSDLIRGDWGRPQNMRTSINSPTDDIGLVLGPNEKYGFLSSAREGGSGDLDIYKFAIECAFINTAKIRGVVVSDDNVERDSKITFVNMASGKKVTTYPTVSEFGSFVAELKTNQHYITTC